MSSKYKMWHCVVCNKTFRARNRERHVEGKVHRRREARRAKVARKAVVPRRDPVPRTEQQCLLGLSDHLMWADKCLAYSLGETALRRLLRTLAPGDLEVAIALYAVVEKKPDLEQECDAVAHLNQNRDLLLRWGERTGSLQLTDALLPQDSGGWKEAIGSKSPAMHRILEFISTTLNKLHVNRQIKNGIILRKFKLPGARFVCIGNNKYNGVESVDELESLIGASMHGRAACYPVILYADDPDADGRHNLYPLCDEPCRKKVGDLRFVRFPEDKGMAGRLREEPEFASDDDGNLLFEGQTIGVVTVTRHSYRGQLKPGIYANLHWEPRRLTYTRGRDGTVLLGLGPSHRLVAAAMRVYCPATERPPNRSPPS